VDSRVDSRPETPSFRRICEGAWAGVSGGRLIFLTVVAILTTTVAIPVAAQADSNCGTSGSHTICVSAAGGTLSGDTGVTVTNSPNSGVVIATWIPAGGTAMQLIESYAPSPATNDYSFVWPTEKYLDGAGTLRLQWGSTGAQAVDISATLNNGNTSDFQHNPNDWANYLPAAWTRPNDPKILAVGDGPSNEVTSNGVAARIASINPPLFLFLGDVYETGTFTEFRNHYGVSALDAPGAGTLWGATANVTQPTVGNHENASTPAFIDYWHQRPLYTKFTFGGVLFLDMDTNISLKPTSKQYKFVQSALITAPPCVVTFWHKPAVKNNTQTIASLQQAWALLANNGVDLLLNGNQHHMVEFKPLDADYNAGTQQAHLVQLVAGTGGHQLAGVANTPPGARIAWSKGKTAGFLSLTLVDAGGGGQATRLRWDFQDVSGNSLRSGSVTC
jgi:hypothetical protein